MFMLQLFDGSDEIHPVDARLLREGVLRVGRDNGADWSISDPHCALSRTHCEYVVAGEELRLRSLGANGVYSVATGERLPQDIDIPLDLPFAVRLGDFRIVATEAPQDDVRGQETRTMVLTPPLGDSIDVPSDWTDKQLAALAQPRTPLARSWMPFATARDSTCHFFPGKIRSRSCAASAVSIARWCSGSAI